LLLTVRRQTRSPMIPTRSRADPTASRHQLRVGSVSTWRRLPVLLIPCIKRVNVRREPAGLWVLYFRPRGLPLAATGNVTRYGVDEHCTCTYEVAELLGIPAGFHPAALIPTAYFTGERSTLRPLLEPVDTAARGPMVS